MGTVFEEDFALAKALQEQELMLAPRFDRPGADDSSAPQRQLTDEELAFKLQQEDTWLQFAAHHAGWSADDAGGLGTDEFTHEELEALTEVVGTVSRGLPAAAIEALPQSSYEQCRAKWKEGLELQGSSASTCCICCSQLEDQDLVTELACRHVYHHGCIGQWLATNKVCPICHKEVSNPMETSTGGGTVP